jgi:hypothetical protein
VVVVIDISGVFCLSPASLVVSGDTPVRLRRASSDCFCSVFLGISGLFYVFPASFEASTKFCIFWRVSGEVSSSCFPANLVG